MKVIDIQVKEEQRIPNKINLKRPNPRYIIIKTPKVRQEGILKHQEKSSYLQGIPHKTVS